MPSPKRKTSRTAKPRATGTKRPTKRATAKPAPAEEPKVEQEPAPTEPEAPPAEPPAEEEQPETAADSEASDESEEPKVEQDTGDEAQPADVEMVELGGVQGRLTLVPFAVVLSLLDDQFMDRVERQRTLPSTLELQERVRATEGRCAPIILTNSEKDGFAFFDGVATVAAAINLSLETVAVVIIEAGDAGAVQSHLVRMLHAARPEPSEDDEHLWRVIAHIG